LQSFAHPFYVSITEVRFIENKKEVQLSCRMFTDDLQEALYKLYGHKVSLHKNNINENFDILYKYITEKIKIKVGNQFINFSMLGYENEDEATWIYLEAKNVELKSKKIEIENSLLYDFLKSQSNLIHCYFNQLRKSSKLDNPNSKVEFVF
jgi:hypothetical protein